MCLSCFYIDGYAYQENELVRQHVMDGHEVVVIASTETYGDDQKITYVSPGAYVGGEGARVIRLPYRGGLPHALMKKLRMHPGVYQTLEAEAPDVVMFHGLCGWELLTLARYKRAHPRVELFVDSHEDSVNSARGFLSRYILHKVYYRAIIRSSLSAFRQVLCVSLDTERFVHETYGIPGEMLEFYPLGGTVLDDSEYLSMRERGRLALGLGPEDIALVQTGKMGRQKKLLETVLAFRKTNHPNLRLILAGQIDADIRVPVLREMEADSRISFIGWQPTEKLRELLCAADLYVQPGTQSATMQMSLCLRCPVVLDDVLSHAPFVDGNGWLVKDSEDLARVLYEVESSPGQLRGMSARSLEVARQLLDYRKLAARIAMPATTASGSRAPVPELREI